MSDLLAARLQMGVSLGFHIVFAVAGMAMPLLMVLAEWRYRRTGDAMARELAVRWSKGTAILFAVGAVSGTVLSFELGLLWPAFMERAGPLIGMPFSLEGFAFFLEAIALGVYLYGWDRVSPAAHLASGVVVAVSGLASGVFVIAVNAFMNTPRGFTLAPDGSLVTVDLVEAFFTPAFPTQAFHMAFAAYASVGFAVLGIHAWRLLRHPSSAFHATALRIVLPVAAAGAFAMLLTGHQSAEHLAREQPGKLAAAEALFETQRGAPLVIGGLPHEETRTVRFALHVPKGLSLLATGDPDGEVLGVDAVPRDEWPNVTVVHVAFEIMVGCGSAMIALAVFALVLVLRKRPPERSRAFLRAAVLSGPLGLVALEAGWTVTEVGRQPWIVRDVLRVADAVTPVPNLGISLAVSIAVYLALAVIVLVLLRRHVLVADLETSEDRE